MFLSHPFLSLILFAVVALGARKVFKFIVAQGAKLLPKVSERNIRRAAWTVVGTSLALMAAPLLLPFGGPVRTFIMLIYVVYVSVSLWSLWNGYYGTDKTAS